jgi:hypothetical protein
MGVSLSEDGSEINAQDLAGDVEGIVDRRLEFIVGAGFDLMAAAGEAAQAGVELAAEVGEAGIVAAGAGFAVLDVAVEVGDVADVEGRGCEAGTGRSARSAAAC